tara:strand:+ start:420 stop:632 length:213 start_codon:yes stop_codon:yes gene_type:complete
MVLKLIFKRLKNLNKSNKEKLNINDWMELPKKERLKLDLNEKNASMKRKKALLKSIREEYAKIKNKKDNL